MKTFPQSVEELFGVSSTFTTTYTNLSTKTFPRRPLTPTIGGIGYIVCIYVYSYVYKVHARKQSPEIGAWKRFCGRVFISPTFTTTYTKKPFHTPVETFS